MWVFTLNDYSHMPSVGGACSGPCFCNRRVYVSDSCGSAGRTTWSETSEEDYHSRVLERDLGSLGVS